MSIRAGLPRRSRRAAVVSGSAWAYPQWQFSSGTSRCSQCHYSPAGGGLINGYGRDAAGEDLSTWEGDGSFLHGAVELPKSLALGFDGRYSALAQNIGEATGRTLRLLSRCRPMPTPGWRWATPSPSTAAVGYRGQARSVDEPTGTGAAVPIASRFISREHYLMWRPAAMGVYARAGRFFAPFGLRLAEHYTYVRRDLGFNLLEESYNLSLGYLQERLRDPRHRLHARRRSATSAARSWARAAMLERRVGDGSALGSAGPLRPERRSVPVHRGHLHQELPGVHPGPDPDRAQRRPLDWLRWAGLPPMASWATLGVSFFPTQGLWVTPFAERRQTSIAVRDTATDAGGVQINWFPLSALRADLDG